MRGADPAAERPQTGYSRLPALLLIDSAIGSLTASFGADNVANVGSPCCVNPSQGLGYVRFMRDAGMGWQPEATHKWDLTRCADRLDRSEENTVITIMLSLVAMALRIGPEGGNIEAPQAVGTRAALVDDIRKLTQIVETKQVSRPVFGRRVYAA